VKFTDRTLLFENGGPIEITRDWALSIFEKNEHGKKYPSANGRWQKRVVTE